MLAVDTNVLVRFLTRDHEDQAQRAKLVLTSGAWVSSTVALELEWVLRASYGYSSARIVEAFQYLIGLPSIGFEAPGRMIDALAAVDRGMDFADALHYAAASALDGCEGLATFDEGLIAAAAKSPGLPVIRP